MGIKDGGEPVYIREEAGDTIELRAKYRTGGRGIEIAAVSERLIASESSDDDFKIMFCVSSMNCIVSHKCQLHQSDVSAFPKRCAVN